MSGSMSQNQREISNGKRPRAREIQGAYKRARGSGYPTAHDGEDGHPYPRHDTAEVMYPERPNDILEAHSDNITSQRTMLTGDELQRRSILHPTARAHRRTPNATQPPVTQTGDVQHAHLAAPFRTTFPSNTASFALPNQAIAHDTPVAPSSSTNFIAHSMGGMDVQHSPAVPAAINHRSMDPGARRDAYQEYHYHDSRGSTKHGHYNSPEKGTRKNSSVKGKQRSHLSSEHAARNTAGQQSNLALDSPPHRRPNLPTQGQAQNGKMNYRQYQQPTQHPRYTQPTQHVQQPQYVQQPQQSTPVMNHQPPLHLLGVVEWLQAAQQDLSDRIIYQIPGIPCWYKLPALDSEYPLLYPNSIWALRSLLPQQRFDQYRIMVSCGLRLLTYPSNSSEYSMAWAAIDTNSRILVQGEHNWYNSFKQGWASPQQRQEELLRVMELQTVPTPVGHDPTQQFYGQAMSLMQGQRKSAPQTRLQSQNMVQAPMVSAPQIHVHGQDMVQIHMGTAPAVQASVAPLVQQRRSAPEVIEIPSRSPSPSPSAQQVQTGRESISSPSAHQLSRPLLLNANGKRAAEVDPGSHADGDDGNDIDEVIMESLGFGKAEEQRKKEERRRRKAIENEEDDDYYKQHSRKVDEIYLGNDKGLPNSDGTRKPKDAVWMKMSSFWTWAEKRGGRAKYIQTPNPASSPARKPKTKRQKTNLEEPQMSHSRSSPATQELGSQPQKAKPEELHVSEPQPRTDQGLALNSSSAPMTNAAVLEVDNVSAAHGSGEVYSLQEHIAARSMPISPPVVHSAPTADDTPMVDDLPPTVSYDFPAGPAYSLDAAPLSPPPAVQAPPSEPFKPASKPTPFQKKVPLNGTPKVSHMARYEAMKVVQRQLLLRSLAIGKSNMERLVVNDIDVAQLLEDCVDHNEIVDRIAPYLEPQRQIEPDRVMQYSYDTTDEEKLLSCLAEYQKSQFLESQARKEAERKLYHEQMAGNMESLSEVDAAGANMLLDAAFDGQQT